MVNRIVSVDDSFVLPAEVRANLPTQAELTATTALATAAMARPFSTSLVFDLRDHATWNTSNIGPALRAQVTAAAVNGGVVYIPPGTYNYVATGVLGLGARVTLRGVPGATILNLSPSVAGAYTEFVRNNGDNVTVEGLIVNRVADFPSVFFPQQTYSGFTIRDCTFNGNFPTYTATNYCHGIEQGLTTSGVSDKLLVERCVFTQLKYALFGLMTAFTCTNTSIVNCVFDSNYATDLEFNAPTAVQTNVLVRDCVFRNNQTTTTGAGFGVGLAHIDGAAVCNNTFSGYNNEAIHVEDYATRILIDGNRLTSCGLLFSSYIQVIQGVSEVQIVNNELNCSANTNFTYAVRVMVGGAGNTAGGRTIIAPRRVAFSNNGVSAGGLGGFYGEIINSVRITGNRFLGSSTVSGGVFSGSNGASALELWSGGEWVITGNTIKGFKNGFQPRVDTFIAFDGGAVISDNQITACETGIGAVNAGPSVISNNSITNCVRPFLLGQGNAAPFPVVAIGNYASGCTYRMEIGGVAIAIANGSATVGTARTLTIKAQGLRLPSGTVVAFAGGGTMTLTGTCSAGATTMTGDVTVASISSGQVATVTGLAHSTVSAQNHVTLANNADSVAGTY